MNKVEFRQKYAPVIKEEVQKLITEVEKKNESICEKLEKLREHLIPVMALESLGQTPMDMRKEKRVQLKTVSEIINVPINELLIHFINEVKNKNDRSLVEYHVGYVYFYASHEK
jgi:hypothetical protein